MDNLSMTWLPELEMEGLGNILRHHQLNPCYSESVDLFSSESFKGSPDVVTTSRSIHVATTNGDVDKQQDPNKTTTIIPFVPSQVSPPNVLTLSFANPTSPQEINHIYGRSKQNYSDVVMPQDNTSLDEILGSIDGTTRCRSTRRNHRQVQEHVLAERKRREKLAERFTSLSTLLPGLKKMNKGTILEDARKYIIQLQTRVKELEQTSVKGKDIIQESSGGSLGISKFCGGDHEDYFSACSFNDTNYLPSTGTFNPEIKARILGSKILVRIYCVKSSLIVLKTLTEMERLHITIVCCSVLPFSNAHVITITAQMSDETTVITAKYLVKCLLTTLRDCH